ncbi:MAG: GGDEF domain-containing protein [Candidatus Accumulibacter sp.]|jgi:diguanylate cyclase|nr:GGDEF domain-containing protein [Accumulibacter sp.]
MNHGNPAPFRSNRPVSHHSHRHVAQPVPAYLNVFPQPAPEASPSLSTLARGPVRNLDALLKRIAELEKELGETRQAVFTDPLTGALNRRGFERAYTREMARSRRSGKGMALIMIDVDDFKALNDQYGHLAGDRVLVHLARVLRESMRPSDVLCRFGGEEFVLMLPGTPIDDACKAAQRFLSVFSWTVSDIGQTVTFSAGVVAHGHSESLDEAIARADAAAYAAKRAGKNQIMPG